MVKNALAKYLKCDSLYFQTYIPTCLYLLNASIFSLVLIVMYGVAGICYQQKIKIIISNWLYLI